MKVRITLNIDKAVLIQFKRCMAEQGQTNKSRFAERIFKQVLFDRAEMLRFEIREHARMINYLQDSLQQIT